MARLSLVASALAAAFFVSSPSYAAYCGGRPDPNAQQNKFPINTAAPVLLGEHDNGKLFLAGQPGFEFHVLHLYGTAYEMG